MKKLCLIKGNHVIHIDQVSLGLLISLNLLIHRMLLCSPPLKCLVIMLLFHLKVKERSGYGGNANDMLVFINFASLEFNQLQLIERRSKRKYVKKFVMLFLESMLLVFIIHEIKRL